MKLQPKQLREGDVVQEDVKSLTKYPIVSKGTALNKEHLEILKAFMIDQVDVDRRGSTDQSDEPDNTDDKSEVQTPVNAFIEQYEGAVERYKRMYKQWQGGAPVNIAKLREFLVPLLEKVTSFSNDILRIHHHSKKDDYLFHHAVSVGLLSAYFAYKMNYRQGEWIQIGLAGALCDAGMAKISPTILNKESGLTVKEYEQVKEHPVFSYKMIKDVPALKQGVSLAVLQHHEREDGSGYPLGTNSDKLHPFSKIVAVADVYHAMITERAYREKQSPFKVVEMITKDLFGKFDHKVVHILIQSLSTFSVGTRIRLTNHDTGEIVFMDPQEPMRPMVKLDHNQEILPLKDHSHLYIEEVL